MAAVVVPVAAVVAPVAAVVVPVAAVVVPVAAAVVPETLLAEAVQAPVLDEVTEEAPAEEIFRFAEQFCERKFARITEKKGEISQNKFQTL